MMTPYINIACVLSDEIEDMTLNTDHIVAVASCHSARSIHSQIKSIIYTSHDIVFYSIEDRLTIENKLWGWDRC